MLRSSKYFDLHFIVQCRHLTGPCRAFETIAAFNANSVALRYAKECGATNRHNEYRVLTRNGRGQFV